jgi:hypothetical protein
MRFVSALALMLVFASCDGATAPQEIDDPTTDKADGTATKPGIGTYRVEGDPDAVPRLDALVLKSNGTFYRTLDDLVADGSGSSGGVTAETGTYKFTKSTDGKTRWIRFADAEGNLIDRWAYRSLTSTGMKLQQDGSSASFAMTKVAELSAAACAEPADCGLQGFDLPLCGAGGSFTCTANTCAYQCGEGSQGIDPAWVTKIKQQYETSGVDGLTEVAAGDLKPHARAQFTADTTDGAGYYFPAAYRMTIEGRSAVLIDYSDEGSQHVTIFDELLDTPIAAGGATESGAFAWDA